MDSSIPKRSQLRIDHDVNGRGSSIYDDNNGGKSPVPEDIHC